MVAELRYSHRSGTRHYRLRSDHGDIEITEEAAAKAGRVAIHISDRQYDVTAAVISQAREYKLEQLAPMSLDAVGIGELDLPGRVFEALDDEPRLKYAGDLMGLSDAELLELRAIGPAAVAAIRARCNYWLQRIAENLAAQKNGRLTGVMRLINKGPATAPRSRTGTDISNLQQPASLTLPAQLNGPPHLSDVHFLCSPVYEKGPWSTPAMYSFTKRKKIVDVSPHVQRICNITTPNYAPIPMGRSDNRYNRAIPTLLGPWQDDHPLVEECIVGLTTNLSDRGVGLVLYQPFLADEVVVGYWVSSELMHNPLFFLGNVRRNQPIGGGFWLVGIELTEYASAEHAEALAALLPSAATLLSPAETATV